MKRLIRKAFGHTFYHATSMESFKSIIETGMIIPQEQVSSDWSKKENIDYYFNGNEELYNQHFKNFDGYTFFDVDQYAVQEYGARAASKSGFRAMYAIIEVNLPEESLLPDLNDAPNAKTWQESVEQVGQICVNGPVTSDYFTGRVFIVLRDLHERITTTINNWERDLVLTLLENINESYFTEEKYKEYINALGIDDSPYRNQQTVANKHKN